MRDELVLERRALLGGEGRALELRLQSSRSSRGSPASAGSACRAVGWTSWIETCWSRISPSAENSTIASWTLPTGTRSDEVRRAALAARAVVDAAHVAVEVAGQAQRALGRAREILHLQRQLGLVQLRAARRRGQAAGLPGRLRAGGRNRIPGRVLGRAGEGERPGAPARCDSTVPPLAARCSFFPESARPIAERGGERDGDRQPGRGRASSGARAAPASAAAARPEASAAASPRTRARSSGDAVICAERISLTIASWSGCDICTHPLFELLQRPAEPGGAVR